MPAWTRTRVALPENQGFDRCVLDSGRPGFRVVVFGGTHGDETEGILAANRLAQADLALRAGIIEVIPIVHEAAYFAEDTLYLYIHHGPLMYLDEAGGFKAMSDWNTIAQIAEKRTNKP